MDVFEPNWKLFKKNLTVWRENHLVKINEEIKREIKASGTKKN